MNNKQVIEVNESLTVILETEYDDCYQALDYLGGWADKPREWCVDRKLQVLLGESIPEPEWSKRQQELEDKLEAGPFTDGFVDEDEINDVEYQELCVLRNKFDKEYQHWEIHHGLKVLSEDLKANWYDHRQYRYYYPPIENYSDCTEEEKIKYCLEDHKRLEDLNDGDWWYEGYQVTVQVNGLEVASASLWGIESDGDRAYKEEIWKDLISECFHNIREKLEKEIETLREKAVDLKVTLQALPDPTDELEKMVMEEIEL